MVAATDPELAAELDLHLATDDDLRQRALPDQAKVTLWLMRDVRDRATLFAHLAGWADVLERVARSPGGDDVLTFSPFSYATSPLPLATCSSPSFVTSFKDEPPPSRPSPNYSKPKSSPLAGPKASPKGEAKGRAEGEAKGRAEGRASSMILAARELHVTDVVRRRIEDCTSVETLDHWLVRAATAASADDIFEG